MAIKFPDIYLKSIYEYIKLHDGELILYKSIQDIYKISYPNKKKKSVGF